MEFAIGILIGVIVGVIFKGKKSRKHPQPSIETQQQRKLQEADEIVTVILPTVNKDK